jgi:chloramphenicol-sensitive protein RarD
MEHRRGIWYGVVAYVLWGLTPIYWNLIESSAASLLLHRIVWSVLILFLIVTAKRQWSSFRLGYATWGSRATTAIAALLLTANWGTYVWAVTNGHIIEASLGYFINPLVSVALGVIVLKEGLQPMQWVAVGIAATGVAAMGILAGVPPWISLILAFSFGLYGLLKKREGSSSAVNTLFGETLVLFLPSVVLLVFASEQAGEAFRSSPVTAAFFIGGGFVTVVPLLLFGASAKRIPLSMLGFLQYIAPTLQLAVGVVVFNESMTRAELLGFATVWIALAIFTTSRYRGQRTRASTSSNLVAGK